MKMKTTLILPERLMRELKRRAAERGQTLSAIVAETLQRGLAEPVVGTDLTPLPTYRLGRPKVDLSDRGAASPADHAEEMGLAGTGRSAPDWWEWPRSSAANAGLRTYDRP